MYWKIISQIQYFEPNISERIEFCRNKRDNAINSHLCYFAKIKLTELFVTLNYYLNKSISINIINSHYHFARYLFQ